MFNVGDTIKLAPALIASFTSVNERTVPAPTHRSLENFWDANEIRDNAFSELRVNSINLILNKYYLLKFS